MLIKNTEMGTPIALLYCHSESSTMPPQRGVFWYWPPGSPLGTGAGIETICVVDKRTKLKLYLVLFLFLVGFFPLVVVCFIFRT